MVVLPCVVGLLVLVVAFLQLVNLGRQLYLMEGGEVDGVGLDLLVGLMHELFGHVDSRFLHLLSVLCLARHVLDLIYLLILLSVKLVRQEYCV